MVTFFVSLAILIIGYFIYSRVAEKVFTPDERKTPALLHPDGVDKAPLPRWKALLIETLNIAGTGPIFGAISGALFGPIVFIWIVVGCLLGGAVHDYYVGMISSRNDGGSIVLLAGKYIGKAMKYILLFFSLLLLVLVTAVFVVSPSSLLSTLFNKNISPVIFMIIILVYYFCATIFPINKVIGKCYPLFGFLLFGMAVVLMIGILGQQGEYPLIELIGNIKDYSAANGSLPWWPFMFTTVACGAVSGFHATQSPVIAKCIMNEKDGRIVFYGAMVLEGIIALIWAASSIAFFKTTTSEGNEMLREMGGGNSESLYLMCHTVLGPTGSIFAIFGAILCPITSGDTALRSCRLILGELFHLDQSKLKNRLILSIPLFAIICLISIWNFSDSTNFNLLWRWFAWSNQVLAAIALIVCSIYVTHYSKYRWGSLITGIPAIVMTCVGITYLLTEPNIALGRWIPYKVGVCIGAGIGVILIVNFIIYLIFYWKKQGIFIEKETV